MSEPKALVIGRDETGASWMEDGGIIVTGGAPVYLDPKQVAAIRAALRSDSMPPISEIEATAKAGEKLRSDPPARDRDTDVRLLDVGDEAGYTGRGPTNADGGPASTGGEKLYDFIELDDFPDQLEAIVRHEDGTKERALYVRALRSGPPVSERECKCPDAFCGHCNHYIGPPASTGGERDERSGSLRGQP